MIWRVRKGIGVATIEAVDKLRCIEREIAMRKTVYPKWVASGRMRRDKADREIAILEAIAADYRQNMVSCA
jgi:hypothetical protein